jgi:peroxiredoxin Q/BCP
MSLEAGAPAPDFTLPDDSGSEVTLSDFRGQLVILYFYPKDNTPGCTTEACDFRDNMARAASQGAVVLGISPDSVASHVKFKAKHELPFPLLADTDHEVAKLYGVWGEKKMYGKTFLGLVRSTFLIDAEGNLARIWRKVKVKGHVDEVLAALEELA